MTNCDIIKGNKHERQGGNHMTDKEQKKAAKAFTERWAGKGDEKQETQLFWIDLLQNVLGVENPTALIQFEKPVVVEKNTKFIDGYPEPRNKAQRRYALYLYREYP